MFQKVAMLLSFLAECLGMFYNPRKSNRAPPTNPKRNKYIHMGLMLHLVGPVEDILESNVCILFGCQPTVGNRDC